MVDVLSGALLVTGAAWSLLAAIGVLKFDDVFSRMHAATKASTLGLLLVLVGTGMRLVGIAGKLALVAALIYVTIPVGAHLVGRAVYHHRGRATIRIDTVDELAEVDR